MNKFHKTVASILVVLMMLTSANFAVLAAEQETAAQPEAVILSASGDASGNTAGVLDGINIDWENYVVESTGTKLTRDYTLGLTDDFLYNTLTNDTEGRFKQVRETLSDEVPVFAPYTKAEIDASKVKFYVSPTGNDHNPGTIDEPFKTPQRAVNAVNKLKSKKGGVTVYFREGVYSILQAVSLTQKSGGSSEKDLVFYSNYKDENVTFTGAMTVSGSQLSKANDATFNRKVKDAVKPYIYSVDLGKLGYTDFGTMTRTSRPALYIDGILYTIARWPNVGMTNMAQYEGLDGSHGVVNIGDIIDDSSIGNYTGKTGTGIEFQVVNPRPFSWENTDNIWFYGYFYMEWCPYHFRVQSWNEDKMTIKSYDYSNYGAQYIKEKNFYYYNILEELDNPGEWFLDNKTGMLYVYPSVEIKDNTLIQVVTATDNLITLSGTKYAVINGITLDMGHNGIRMENSANRNLVQHTTIKNASNYCIEHDTTVYENGVTCSILFGESSMNGPTPELNNRIAGNFIQNCYSKRITITSGSRDIVSHCLITGFDTMGISTSASSGDKIVEYNEFVAGPDVGLDAGLFYNNGGGRNAGNIVRYNFFNRSTITPRHTPIGIYLDDLSGGMYVYGNVLNEARIFLHSGSDNMIYNNLICKLPDVRSAIGNSTRYGHGSAEWGSVVIPQTSSRYTKRYGDYYTLSWTSRFPYQYDWQRRILQHTYDHYFNPNYVSTDDEEGLYLSSPKNNVYKNNIAVDIPVDVEIISREIDYVVENNYLFEDPSVLEFTDWDNGVLDFDDETLSKLTAGIEPFKKNVQMGPIFDPALLDKPLELPEIKPAAPMNSAEVKILPTGVTLIWNEAFGKSSYNVKLATDPEFKDIILETETQAEELALPDLEFGKQYYWTVSTNSWTEKVSKTPSVMETATFVTYTFEEAVDMIELDTVEMDAAFKSMSKFLDAGNVVEEGSPEAENYPSDMPLYKEGTIKILRDFIEEGKVKRDEFKLQDDLDKYCVQWQKDFYIKLAENAIPYTVNFGKGSHEVVAEKFKKNTAGIVDEYLGDTLKLSGGTASGVVASTVRGLSAGATLAMSVRHERLDEYTGVDISGSIAIPGGITSVSGYCLIFKSDLIELQRYPQAPSGAVLADVVNNNQIIKPGEWFDLVSEVRPTSEGVHVTVKIDGETIFDYLDVDATIDCYAPAYYGFMHQAKNVTTEYSSVSDMAALDGDFVSTAALERAIEQAQAFEETITESDLAAETVTYKTGTKAKLQDAIATAKSALAAVEAKEDVKAAADALNTVVADIKKNDTLEFTYAIKELDLSLWESTSALAAISLASDNTVIEVVPNEKESTVFAFKNPLAPKQLMKFGFKYDNVGDWQAIATRQLDTKVIPTKAKGYFFVIKEDLIEFQKYLEKGNGEIVAMVPNNGQIKSGETYEFEVGSVNVDGGVLSTLKVNGNVVLEYLDTDNPIYEEGYFLFYCHNTLGKVSISSAK